MTSKKKTFNYILINFVPISMFPMFYQLLLLMMSLLLLLFLFLLLFLLLFFQLTFFVVVFNFLSGLNGVPMRHKSFRIGLIHAPLLFCFIIGTTVFVITRRSIKKDQDQMILLSFLTPFTAPSHPLRFRPFSRHHHIKNSGRMELKMLQMPF